MPESKVHVCKTPELGLPCVQQVGEEPTLSSASWPPKTTSGVQVATFKCKLQWYILEWAKPWHVPPSSQRPRIESVRMRELPQTQAPCLLPRWTLPNESVWWGLTGKGFPWPCILPRPFPTCPSSELQWAVQGAQEPWGTSPSAMKSGPCGSHLQTACPHFANWGPKSSFKSCFHLCHLLSAFTPLHLLTT